MSNQQPAYLPQQPPKPYWTVGKILGLFLGALVLTTVAVIGAYVYVGHQSASPLPPPANAQVGGIIRGLNVNGGFGYHPCWYYQGCSVQRISFEDTVTKLNASSAVTPNGTQCTFDYCYSIVVPNQRTYAVSVIWSYQNTVNTCSGGTAYVSAPDTSTFTFDVNC
jgi:hypothetical protein